jgi:hypothetical protein
MWRGGSGTARGGRVSTRLALTFTLALFFAAALSFASNGEGRVSDLCPFVGPPFLAVIIIPFVMFRVASLLLSEGEGWLGKASGSCHGTGDGLAVLVLALTIKVPLHRMVQKPVRVVSMPVANAVIVR